MNIKFKCVSPNIKYFRRRLLQGRRVSDDNETKYRIADDDQYTSKDYGRQTYAKDIMIQTEKSNEERTAIKLIVETRK